MNEALGREDRKAKGYVNGKAILIASHPVPQFETLFLFVPNRTDCVHGRADNVVPPFTAPRYELPALFIAGERRQPVVTSLEHLMGGVDCLHECFRALAIDTHKHRIRLRA